MGLIHEVLISVGLDLPEELSPWSYQFRMKSIVGDDQSTFAAYFELLCEDKTFESLSMDTKTRYLVRIQMDGSKKEDSRKDLTCVVTDFEHKLHMYFDYFTTVASIKFIFSTARKGPQPKVFNCPIHGHIKLSPLSVKVMDTPQFQRLRDISQLGSTCYVFGGAASKRFEHSIGVAHLARTFVRKLKDQQPELNISETDALCVEIAGLCHDLGHGPFSHLFDITVLPMLGAPASFCHEHASIGIFDLLIKDNNLLPYFLNFGVGEDDIHFIQELILGDAGEAPEGFVWRGRGKKTFLYDIVANKRNGVDVDRFDYFRRDCHLLGVKVGFDDSRLMEFARVHYVTRSPHGNSEVKEIADDNENKHSTPKKRNLTPNSSTSVFGKSVNKSGNTEIEHGDKNVNGALEISFHIKEAWNIFELFHTRYTLHKRAYHHPVSDAIDIMVAEAMVLADPYVFIPGTDRKPTRMSETVHDMRAYANLGEYLFKVIEHSFDPNLQRSRDLISRIRKRDLFVCASELLLSPEDHKNLGSDSDLVKKEILEFKKRYYVSHSATTNESIKMEMQSEVKSAVTKTNSETVNGNTDSPTTVLIDRIISLKDDDIFCRMIKMGFGKGKLNPVTDSTSFYQPQKNAHTDSDVTYAEGIVHPRNCSRLIPSEFEETYLRLYCRHKHQAEAVRTLLDDWCRGKDVQVEKILTPHRKRKVQEL